MKLILLTGAHGSGKSYIGRRIADALGAAFVDNVGCSRYFRYFMQEFITCRYALRLLLLRIKRVPLVVATRAYLDQYMYALYYKEDKLLVLLLRALAKRQLLNPKTVFIYLPPVPELKDKVELQNKWRPGVDAAEFMDVRMKDFLRQYCPAGKCIDLPGVLETRKDALVGVVDWLRQNFVESKGGKNEHM